MEAVPPPASPASPRSRRWIWLLLVILLLVIVGAGAVWYNFAGKNRAYKSTEPYRMALKLVQQDPQVIERLGEPVRDVTAVPSGTMYEEGPRGSADFLFRVAGPKGQATVQTQARRIAGQWGLALLQVTFEDGRRITLDVEAGNEAPKFNPGGGGETPKFNPEGGEAPKFNPAPEAPKPKPDTSGPDLRLEIPK